jgi:phosphoglycerol transferase
MKALKNILIYLASPILSLVILTLMFQLWKFDLRAPIFSYYGDGLVHIFIAKTIAISGWFFQNDFVGHPHIDGSFFFHDFPLHSDAFNFFVIKIFSYFSQDPFLLTNCFFLFTFSLVSFCSFVVLRVFKINFLLALLISILYAFLPYHFLKNINHLLLSNYALIPLVVMVSLWICDGKIMLFDYNHKKQISLAPNRLFFISALVAIFAALNGAYYAIYGCFIFGFSWLLYSLKSGKFVNREFFATVAICLIVLVSLILIYLPAFAFWFKNGFNPNMANRSVIDSEIYALGLINLLLPISNHYLDFLSNFATNFNQVFYSNGEKQAESLGIFASVGFLFLILLLLARLNGSSSFLQKLTKRFALEKEDRALLSNLAGLNIMTILFATVGGLVIFFAIYFPLLRSHARFCVFIAFFSFFALGIIFNKVVAKNLAAKILAILIFVFALFDQVGDLTYFRSDAEKMSQEFARDLNFVSMVEKNLQQDAKVFILPIFGFIGDYGDNYESLALNLHSQNLNWSYPIMKGRATYLWQKKVENLAMKDFVLELKKAGFEGVVIDRQHLISSSKDGKQKLMTWESGLKKLSKNDFMISSDGRWAFLKL